MRKYERAKEIARKQIKIDEGCRLNSYRDTVGVWTDGWGNTKNVVPNGKITQAKADADLEYNLESALVDATKLPVDFDGLNAMRQSVLINMCFNIGYPKLILFKKMLAAVRIRDFNTAALEMLNSRWAKQVKSRATRLVSQMKDGV